MRPASLEALVVGPLPAVLELGGVRRLVVGGVEVVDARFEARLHQVKILIGEGDVDQQFGLNSRIRATVSGMLSASTCAVLDLAGQLPRRWRRSAKGYGLRDRSP
jgi:hypothetical protein